MPYPKTDTNQKNIVKHLRELGCEVSLTHSMGKGFPDLVVYNPRNGLLRMVEVKRPGERLNGLQVEFHKKHGATAFVATTPEEAAMGMGLGGWRK